MKYLILCLALCSTHLIAEEENPTLNLQGFSIVGDKELPKVLYIVPWETHKATPITPPKYTSTLDQPFHFINKPNDERLN